MKPDRNRLPSKPLRNWLLAWHIHTGDPAEVIAKGFDLDPALVVDLRGETPGRFIERSEAASVCWGIRVAPSALWPSCTSGGRNDRESEPLWSEIPKSLHPIV